MIFLFSLAIIGCSKKKEYSSLPVNVVTSSEIPKHRHRQLDLENKVFHQTKSHFKKYRVDGTFWDKTFNEYSGRDPFFQR